MITVHISLHCSIRLSAEPSLYQSTISFGCTTPPAPHTGRSRDKFHSTMQRHFFQLCSSAISFLPYSCFSPTLHRTCGPPKHWSHCGSLAPGSSTASSGCSQKSPPQTPGQTLKPPRNGPPTPPTSTASTSSPPSPQPSHTSSSST